MCILRESKSLVSGQCFDKGLLLDGLTLVSVLVEKIPNSVILEVEQLDGFEEVRCLKVCKKRENYGVLEVSMNIVDSHQILKDFVCGRQKEIWRQ